MSRPLAQDAERRTVVICRDYQQFGEWCRANKVNRNSRKVKHLRYDHDLRGLTPGIDLVIVIDGWWDTQDAKQVMLVDSAITEAKELGIEVKYEAT